MERIYHYTSLVHLDKILSDRFLKISDADKMLGIKPAIWFSKNKDWEPTATKMVSDDNNQLVSLSKEEQLKTIGMARIGIQFSNKLISWRKYFHVGRIPPQLFIALEQIGIEKGAKPSQWYCSLKNIPATEWDCVEYFNGSDWINVFEIEDEELSVHPNVL